MPFEGEYATGESLLSLQQSEAFREFKGLVRPRPPGPTVAPTILNAPRNNWMPRRVIAVDGSTVSEALDNGFPMAEATLMKVAVVSIDLSKLTVTAKDDIPSPRAFYDMESASTFDCVLPGANIIRPDLEGDTPRRFFRQTAFDAFNGRLDTSHETLMETVRAVVGGPHTPTRAPRCPIEECPHELAAGIGAYPCGCEQSETLFETDGFRFAERFSEVSSNGEAHGEVRHVLEIVSLVNMLRFFAHNDRLTYLRDNVFIVDGPLALFGHPAWLTPYLRRELRRINDLCRAQGFGLAVFGYEKSGTFVEHFERLDASPERGPRSRHPPGTAFGLDATYINRNVTLRPADAKPHGQDTYFGRKVFYKTAAGEHAVITTAMTTEASQEFRRCDLACYPRLGDMLNVLDRLATYLHRDGFMPLVRAHAHAAIPLRRGADIIRSLFGN
jgi:hypothetical protein